jgi:hypothetical protein
VLSWWSFSRLPNVSHDSKLTTFAYLGARASYKTVLQLRLPTCFFLHARIGQSLKSQLKTRSKLVFVIFMRWSSMVGPGNDTFKGHYDRWRVRRKKEMLRLEDFIEDFIELGC